MADEQALRRALLSSVLLVFAVAIYHRLRAHATGEPLDRRQEGWFILATLRPAGLVTILAMITYFVSPARIAWASLPLPVSLRWSGIALLALDAVLLGWTLHTLGKNLTDTVVTRRAHTLVTNGPYRWIRHPFYACVGLLVLSISLAAANWFLFAAGSTVLLLLGVRTATEEANLLARFGQPYRSYMEQTGKFLPKLRAAGPR